MVDDLPTNRKLLRIMLEPEGHEVVEAADGLEALEILEREKIEAIISDILMPRMDGYRFCYGVRKTERTRELPFIICSSTYTSPADRRLALEVGADKYFKNPVAAKEVLAALEEFSREAKYKMPRNILIPTEETVMREYNEVLVRKLEEKNTELEKTQAELLRVNRELENLIHERTAELEAANLELEAFNRSVSHDLRTPLTEIYVYSQLLQTQQGADPDRYGQEFAGKIVRAAKKMDLLIKELMKLSQVQHSEVCRRPVDLSAVVSAIVERLPSLEAPRTVEFIVAPGVAAEADGALVQIALDNLLNNAWKYTAKREQTRIEFGKQKENGATVYFVRDNGAGFDMALASRLFQPFERLHSSEEFLGTGIGLTIVQRVIARHGGRIWAESRPGEGATFYFTLAQ